MMDMGAVGRATGSGSGEIVEELSRRDREWEDDDETLQTRNYTGTREDVVTYCYSFDLDIPIRSTDSVSRSVSQIVTGTGSHQSNTAKIHRESIHIPNSTRRSILRPVLPRPANNHDKLPHDTSSRTSGPLPHIRRHGARCVLTTGYRRFHHYHCRTDTNDGLGYCSAAYLAYTVFGTLPVDVSC